MLKQDDPGKREKHDMMRWMFPPRTIEDVVKRVPIDPDILGKKLEHDAKRAPIETKQYIEKLRKQLQKGKFKYREVLQV